jgi:hypothetical protein
MRTLFLALVTFLLVLAESVVSTHRPVLAGGMEYWIIASTLDHEASAGWKGSFTDNRPMPGAIRRVDTEWSRGWPNGAFRVYAERLDTDTTAPVPEPATMALVGFGVAAVVRGVRRRHRRES